MYKMVSAIKVLVGVSILLIIVGIIILFVIEDKWIGGGLALGGAAVLGIIAWYIKMSGKGKNKIAPDFTSITPGANTVKKIDLPDHVLKFIHHIEEDQKIKELMKRYKQRDDGGKIIESIRKKMLGETCYPKLTYDEMVTVFDYLEDTYSLDMVYTDDIINNILMNSTRGKMPHFGVDCNNFKDFPETSRQLVDGIIYAVPRDKATKPLIFDTFKEKFKYEHTGDFDNIINYLIEYYWGKGKQLKLTEGFKTEAYVHMMNTFMPQQIK